MVVGGLVAGGFVAWTSAPGREFFALCQRTWQEAKRVVWPTRKETLQTTAVVFAFVVRHGAVPVGGGCERCLARSKLLTGRVG